MICSDEALGSALCYEIAGFKTADNFSVLLNLSRVHILLSNPERPFLPPNFCCHSCCRDDDLSFVWE